MSVPISDIERVLRNKRVAFVGKLGGLNRREAFRLVRQCDGTPVDRLDKDVDLVVLGDDELPLDDELLIDDQTREAAAKGDLEIITETQLWNRLGLVEFERNVHQLYTPAMLAKLLNVKVSIIRRWHRRGLIVPVREVHRLPYFDFQEVATARHLAKLLSAGASPAAIERKLEQLARLVPDAERPLAQLNVIIEGRQLLLRQGEGLIEPGGQKRFDFDAVETVEEDAPEEQDEKETILSISSMLSYQAPSMSIEEMLSVANDLEDEGNFREAAEMYRAVLVAGGPTADVCFRLAELLYLIGETLAARERYSMAIELDENFVEARANLGCILVEIGDPELAISAFEGALVFHNDYPDVHYHLARTLDEVGRTEDAQNHWKEFLTLSPNSPWADEARERLGLSIE